MEQVNMQEHKETPISGVALSRAMTLNIVAGSIGMLWFWAVGGVFITGLITQLKGGNLALAVVASVPLLANSLQMFSALIVNRLRSRKRYWFTTALIHGLVWFIIPLLILSLHWIGFSGALVGILLVVAVSGILTVPGVAPWWSWMGDLIPEGIRG